MQYSQQQILALDPCGTSSLNKLTSREAEAGSHIAIQFSCNTKAKQSKEEKKKQRNSSALDKYSKLRFFLRLGWRVLPPDCSTVCIALQWDAATTSASPGRPTTAVNYGVILGLQTAVGTVAASTFQNHHTPGLQHFGISRAHPAPPTRNLSSPMFYIKPAAFVTEIITETLFSAAWYMLLADTRWRWKDKISREITKLCCSRSGKINIQTLSYITIDPKWKFYHSLATAWYDLHWLSDPLQQSRFEI